MEPTPKMMMMMIVMMMTIGHEGKTGSVWEISGRGKGKGKATVGGKGSSRLHVYVLRQHNEANQIMFKNGGRKRNITNLFKIYHRHVRNYHSKTLSYY
jgi:hypothetical protein